MRKPRTVCALPGCERLIPKVAQAHLDDFCSTGHFQVFHGLKDPARDAADRRASDSGRLASESTVGGWKEQGHHSWARAQRGRAT